MKKENSNKKISANIILFGQSNNIYQIGILTWFMLWVTVLFVSCVTCYWNWLYLCYLIPIGGGIYVLYRNNEVWKKEITTEKYPEEVKLIEFVERNANYVILGITALFIASEIIFKYKDVNLTGFYFFQILSLCFSIGFVLPLIWRPRVEDNASSLVLLRHWKTVWYTYSIYLFLSATLALLFTLLGIN